jgi:hypothetical protein
MKRLAFLATIACLCGCALPAIGRAGTVYSTFGEPGDTFNTGGGTAVAGSGSVFHYDAQAMAFTPSTSVTLDSFRFAFFTSSTGYLIDAIITKDSSGSPGAALETFSSITAPKGTAGVILTEDSIMHPELDAGTSYWLVLQPHDPGSSDFGTWNQSLPVAGGGNASRSSPTGAWEAFTFGAQDAFDIQGTPLAVPEPASLTLAGVAAAGLLGYRWRHRKRAA